MATEVLDAAGDALATAENVIALLEAELAELRAEYAADPRNFKLAETVGVATNKLLAEKRKATVADRTDRTDAMRAWRQQERTRVRLDDRQWEALLPATCPVCGGQPAHAHGMEKPLGTRGYTVRLGEFGARCLICHGEYKVGER